MVPSCHKKFNIVGSIGSPSPPPRSPNIDRKVINNINYTFSTDVIHSRKSDSFFVKDGNENTNTPKVIPVRKSYSSYFISKQDSEILEKQA